MKAIADNVEEFHIAYTSGDVLPEWKQHFTFHHFMEYFYDPNKAGWRKSLGSIIRPSYAFWLTFTSKRLALQYFINYDIDLIYVLSGYWAVEICRHLAEKMKIPYVVRLRGNYQEELLHKHPLYTRWFYLSMALRSLKKADLVIPISQRLAKYACYWSVDKCKIADAIPLGIDPNKFKQTFPHKNKTLTLGYAGRITQEKGAFRLIQLMKQLSHVNFFVAGIKQCKIRFPSNAYYFGKLAYEDMPKFYNSIDALIVPSYTEGFPCVILEAYACGKPIVATYESVPDELKVFGKIGQFEEFPKLISELENSNINKIGEEARAYAELSFKWENFGQSIVKQLESLGAN